MFCKKRTCRNKSISRTAGAVLLLLVLLCQAETTFAARAGHLSIDAETALSCTGKHLLMEAGTGSIVPETLPGQGNRPSLPTATEIRPASSDTGTTPGPSYVLPSAELLPAEPTPSTQSSVPAGNPSNTQGSVPAGNPLNTQSSLPAGNPSNTQGSLPAGTISNTQDFLPAEPMPGMHGFLPLILRKALGLPLLEKLIPEEFLKILYPEELPAELLEVCQEEFYEHRS